MHVFKVVCPFCIKMAAFMVWVLIYFLDAMAAVCSTQTSHTPYMHTPFSYLQLSGVWSGRGFCEHLQSTSSTIHTVRMCVAG